MSAEVVLRPLAPRPIRTALRVHLAEIGSELLKTIRTPAYAIPTLTFPAVFYLFFAIALPGGGGDKATYLLATYGVFGSLGCALFGFGVGVAIERGQGWLTVKMASPMPVSAYFSAKIAMSLIFSLGVFVLLSTIAVFFGDVSITAVTWSKLCAVVVVGALPYCALGLALGTVAGPNSAAALVNLIYLPMAIISGLWFPTSILPSWMQKIAPCLPAWHHGQLSLSVIGISPTLDPLTHLAAMGGFTLLFLVVAGLAWRRSADKLWG